MHYIACTCIKMDLLKRGAALYILIVLYVTVCDCLSPQCRNEKGEPVDWFYIYKLPREKNHLNPLVRKGVAYMYLIPSKLRSGWIMSEMSISDPRSMVGQTLAPLYQDKNIISVLYNDQPPQTEYQPDLLESVAQLYSKSKRGQTRQAGMKKFKRFKLGDKFYDDYDLAEMCKMHTKFMKTRVESGHTKGAILGDKFTSLWLVHSVPRFPPVPDNYNSTAYSYPASGTKYGQTFLCTSVQTSTLNQIAIQLKYNEPLLVHQHLPQEFESELPNLFDLIHNKTIDASPWYHIESFETLVGRKFLSFAKSAMFNDDLYSGLVAEVLQSDLLVESWTNGPGTLDSECTRNFQVRNIERLKFPIAKMSFTSHNDHSKWAVAVAHKMQNSQDTKVADYWVCVGDINRALSQESRGGGTVCTSGPILWGNFAHLIESVETCAIWLPRTVLPVLESEYPEEDKVKHQFAEDKSSQEDVHRDSPVAVLNIVNHHSPKHSPIQMLAMPLNFALNVNCFKLFEGWGAITIHCRDNDDKPVDWWYMYKPPSGILDTSSYDNGRNFTYITSRSSSRWKQSVVTITGNSMLQKTLNPLYRKTYTDHLAGIVYGKRHKDENDSTLAYGVVMTDIMGGLWMAHTIPNFPDKTLTRAAFPEEELDNGHLVICLSVSVKYLNKVVEAVKAALPNVKYHFVAKGLKSLLYNWDTSSRRSSIDKISVENIKTRKGKNTVVMSRPPGNDVCLYEQFARDNGLVLDVYGQATKRTANICRKEYSLRNIKEISIKDTIDEKVYYLRDNGKIDYSNWAVSTAVHWQRQGVHAPKFWTCINSLNKGNARRKGGVLICMEDYGVWSAFDNLKVAEPMCDSFSD